MRSELATHAEKLFYFYEIARTGSIQATARKLNTSASTLLYSVKILEGICGTPLLERSKKGVKATSAGLQLVSLGEDLLRRTQVVQEQIRMNKSSAPVRLKVGTFSSIAIYLWPKIMKELSAAKEVSLSITTGRSREILEMLLRRDIDIALTVESFTAGPLLKHELYDDQFSFYYYRPKLAHSKWEELPLFYIPDASDASGKELRHYISQQNLNFSEHCELDSFEVIAKFIEKGYGIGILPNRVASSWPHKLYRLTPAKGKSEFGLHRFYLTYRKDLEIPQSVITSVISAAKKAVISTEG
jgi:molybdate transport repressor ModE-like protein